MAISTGVLAPYGALRHENVLLPGNLGHHGDTWFVNFKGMVDTQNENAFAIAEIFVDRMEIIGFGREDSRQLPFSL